jgi:DNA-binding winged helix-turn-helix (wHTH) protein
LQTVVGRGYRFVAEITVDDGDGEGFKISPEEFGQALMAAAGLKPEEPETPPKRRPS